MGKETREKTEAMVQGILWQKRASVGEKVHGEQLTEEENEAQRSWQKLTEDKGRIDGSRKSQR